MVKTAIILIAGSLVLLTIALVWKEEHYCQCNSKYPTSLQRSIILGDIARRQIEQARPNLV